MRLSRADKIKAAEIAEKHGITFDEAKAIIASQWQFIREKTKGLDFPDGLTKEEFEKKKTNFNIPAIGKLYASFYLYSRIQKNKKKKFDDSE